MSDFEGAPIMKSAKRKMGTHELRAVNGLVVAAHAGELRDACNVLYIHGGLLSGATRASSLLVRWHGEVDVCATAQLASAKASLAMKRLLRAIMPPLLTVATEHAVREADGEGTHEGDVAEVLVARTIGQFVNSQEGIIESMIAGLFCDAPALVGGAAGAIISLSRRLREQQSHGLGGSVADYDEMVDNLAYIDGVGAPIVRVTWRQDGSSLQLTCSATDVCLPMAPLADDLFAVELFAFNPALNELKHGSRDRALPAFIAAYMLAVSDYPIEEEVLACAEYTEPHGEFDVVVPSLKLGIEVKLCKFASAQDVDSLNSLSGNLEKQLARYVRLGCTQLIVVTNLDDDNARRLSEAFKRRVINDGRETAKILAGVSVEFLPRDIGALLERLDEIVAELATLCGQRLEHAARAKLTQERDDEPTGEAAERAGNDGEP